MLTLLPGGRARAARRQLLESSAPGSSSSSLQTASGFPEVRSLHVDLAGSQSPLDFQRTSIEIEPVRRRRYRSRSCRTFRQYGAFFQFADADVVTSSDGRARRGRSFNSGRAVGVRQARMLQELEHVYARIQQLQEQRDLVESRVINARAHAVSYALDVTTRFYELFSHGFNPTNRPQLSQQADVFIRAAMVEDVVCTEFTGVDPFLRQYELGTANHAAFRIELKRVTLVENGDDALQIKAEATTHFRISRLTLERLFPSIIQDEELTQSLIGKEYEMQYDKVFHFAGGRIFQHESRIDLCSGLLQMVGDPFLALKLFQASLFTKHGHWKVSDEVAEDRHELTNSAF